MWYSVRCSEFLLAAGVHNFRVTPFWFVCHLSLRVSQRFLRFVVELMGVDLSIPVDTTVSRRHAGLALELHPSRTRVPRHVVIDTTGLKVFGAGERSVREHGMGRGRRRIWRKLHLGIDEAMKEIVAGDLTTSGVHDGPNTPAMLDRVPDEVGSERVLQD